MGKYMQNQARIATGKNILRKHLMTPSPLEYISCKGTKTENARYIENIGRAKVN